MTVGPEMTLWVALLVWMTVKMHGLSVLQFLASRRERRLRNPEDVQAFGRLGFQRVEVPSSGIGQRLDHAWRNDLENIPVFLITSLALVLLGASGTLLTVVLVGYGVGRTAHSAAYAAGVQPWRTLSFGVALTFQVVATGWVAALALG